jgi:hypothetical protein
VSVVQTVADDGHDGVPEEQLDAASVEAAGLARCRFHDLRLDAVHFFQRRGTPSPICLSFHSESVIGKLEAGSTTTITPES